MALAPLVKLRKSRIDRMPKGTMRSREWVRGTGGVRTKSSDRTSHQPGKKRHVDGTGETLSSSLSSGVDQGQGQSQYQGKDNAQGDASMRRPRRRQEGRKGRRQHETLRASPTQVSAVPPPRYP